MSLLFILPFSPRVLSRALSYSQVIHTTNLHPYISLHVAHATYIMRRWPPIIVCHTPARTPSSNFKLLCFMDLSKPRHNPCLKCFFLNNSCNRVTGYSATPIRQLLLVPTCVMLLGRFPRCWRLQDWRNAIAPSPLDPVSTWWSITVGKKVSDKRKAFTPAMWKHMQDAVGTGPIDYSIGPSSCNWLGCGLSGALLDQMGTGRRQWLHFDMLLLDNMGISKAFCLPDLEFCLQNNWQVLLREAFQTEETLIHRATFVFTHTQK